MILTCDECQSRYLVAGHAVGPEGRRVRCTGCGHEWFQDAEDVPEDILDDDGTLEDEAQEEPIPESVRPVLEGASVPVITEGNIDDSLGWPYVSYAAAAVVFFVVMGGLLAMHNGIAKIWPATAGFYDLVGMKTMIDGETLIFDRLGAVVKSDKNGDSILNVKAEILNLSQKEENVPFVQASLLGVDGETVDSWLVEPEHSTVESGGEITFNTSYPQVSKDMKEVNIRFIVGSEIKTPKEKGVHEDEEAAQASPEDLHESEPVAHH